MAKTIVQNYTRSNKPIIQGITKADNIRVIKQNKKREFPKIPSFSSPKLIDQIKSFTQSNQYNYYLGFGGMGDALLLLASCWDDPKAKVIFFANHQPFIRNFFELFGINLFLHDNIMGTAVAGHIYDTVIKLPTFKQSAHLADGLNYGDWANEIKYVSRIKNYVAWRNYLGVTKSDMPTVIIAPSGSNKDIKRQRFLHHHEYKKLSDIYLDKGYKVYATGSLNDLHHYKIIDRDNFYWLSSDKIYTNKKDVSSNLKNMLKIINGADLVISMDTYLKTYTLLCEIPTIVLKTRWDRIYHDYGKDITDYIFLNLKIWAKLNMLTIEEILT